MDNKKSYYAIIPANVRYDKRLKPNAKLLYGEITALCNEKGYCWASNDYFAELYEVKKETISRWITDLVEFGYLKRELVLKKDTKQVINRYLFLNQEGIDEKINTPIDEKVKDNNTSFNNTKDMSSSLDEEDSRIPYKEIIDYLNEKTGKVFRFKSAANRKLIKARFNDGNTLDDFKKVIDVKTKQWMNDASMNQYLRPATLFGSKFDQYRSEHVERKSAKQPNEKKFWQELRDIYGDQ